MAKPVNLPPDAPLISLASIINARLGDGARVNFYRIDHGEGSHETGIVYQAGLRRAVVKTRAMLGDADADEIVKSITEWAAEVRHENKWTTDPKEAA